MNARHLARIASITALLAGSVLATGTAASAQPPTNGCPDGFVLWTVADHLAAGYHLPVLVNDPLSGVRSFGRPGNGDDYVCARLVGVTENGSPLYEFIDNTLPASSK
ncbi:MAG: hypothetical protein ABIQ53_16890 [Terracoccus sp.]